MEKAESILRKMTLEQKIAQLQCAMAIGTKIDVQKCPDGVGEAVIMPVFMTKEELADIIRESADQIRKNACDVPPIFHVETLTGVSLADATVFPSAIGLGATFNEKLVEKSAAVIHDQARAVGYNQALAPVLDVCRDPRWGRIGETYGEDPTLNAMLGTSYVRGLQGTEEDKLCATGKHFLGYGMSSGGLNMSTCMASGKEIREVYAKPFQAAITEGGLMSVMNSYGTVDGEMIIGSENILTRLLREEMEFDGIVVSDYASIEHLADHHVAPGLEEAGCMALEAGLDVECPVPRGYDTQNLIDAVKTGRLSERVIDEAALRVLKTKEKLGLLDLEHTEKNRMGTEDFSSFTDPESFGCTYRAAQESIVLLKNNGILPLQKKKQKIAVLGPHADSVRLLFGCYTYAAGTDMMIGGSLSDQAGMDVNVENMSETMEIRNNVPKYKGSTVEKDNEAAMEAVERAYPETKTILESLKEKTNEAEFLYEKGCDIAGCDRSGFEKAIKIAEQSDVVILTLGGKYGWGGSCTVGEGIDTDDIGLTGIQEEFAVKILDTGKPVIVVHMDARPLSSHVIAERADAIMENWFPGTSGGMAVADVLFGDYNPAGRLPITVARSAGQIPVYHSQYIGNSYYSDKCPTSSVRYVDSTTQPLYYFGYGLSYTEFEYSELSIEKTGNEDDESVCVSCCIKNIGEKDGDEVVQVYVSDLLSSVLRPYQEFAGCARIHLKAGEEKKLSFTMKTDQFAFVDKDNKWIVEEGDMEVKIGSASNQIKLTGTFHIDTTRKIRPAKRGFFAKVKY